jgi:hypothetical protein
VRSAGIARAKRYAYRNRPTDETTTPRFILRVLGLGSLLIFVNCAWLIATENHVVHTGGLSVFSIFPTVLFTLVALTLINFALRRYAAPHALSGAELATVYVMISVATSLAGHDIVKQLVPLMGNAFWYATHENDWAALFHAHLPTWLTVRDEPALTGYYEGGAMPWHADIWPRWAAPFLAWTALTAVVLFGMLCVTILLRRQWMDHEKLNYPIAQLPIEVIGSGETLFRSRLLWAGFAVAFGIELMAGLNFLYPAIPMVNLKVNLAPLFQEKPWSAMNGMPLHFYAFAVGLAFLMPVDLSLSFWVFFLTWKAQHVIAARMGWPPADAWHAEGRAGAWLALALIAVWSGRHHLRRVLVTVSGRGPDDEDARLYRFAAYGALASGLFTLVFARAAGLQLWAALLYFGMYLAFCIAMTRMRAELGPPTHELHNVRPDRIMVLFAGTRAVGARNLTVMRLFSWLSYGYRCHPMPHQMEGFKIGGRFGTRDRRLITAMVVAGALGAVFGIGMHILVGYMWRPIYVMGGPYRTLGSWLAGPRDPDMFQAARVLFGAAVTVGLAALKRRFVWWPFYPVGYAVSYGWAISWMWFSIFLGWAAKRVILTSGGIGGYRRAIPFFLGLVIGQFIAGSGWCLVGVAIKRIVYSPFP